MSNKKQEIQTTMSFGKPHFSQGHANHQRGSQSPVQVDWQLRKGGKVIDSVGCDSSASIQTKLTQFKY